MNDVLESVGNLFWFLSLLPFKNFYINRKHFQRIAMCRVCNDPRGVLKPDIVFFGEDLPDEFHDRMVEDRPEVLLIFLSFFLVCMCFLMSASLLCTGYFFQADLLVVIGSSLKVQPVALIPFSVEPNVPQILINRESLSNYTPDIELLGNCDDIIAQIALALGPPYTEIFKKGCFEASIKKLVR